MGHALAEQAEILIRECRIRHDQGEGGGTHQNDSASRFCVKAVTKHGSGMTERSDHDEIDLSATYYKCTPKWIKVTISCGIAA